MKHIAIKLLKCAIAGAESDLYLAKRALDPARVDINAECGNSGKSRKQILDEYQRRYDDLNKTLEWVIDAGESHSGWNIWEVSYFIEFRSSSTDSGDYKKEFSRSGFVETNGGSLADVREEIRRSLTHQESLLELTKAVVIGKIL